MTPTDSTSVETQSWLTYALVYLALLGLLGLSVLAASFDLGPWHAPVSLAIAGVKAGLVVWFFMHVRKSSSLTRLFVLLGFLWLAVLVVLTVADYLTRL